MDANGRKLGASPRLIVRVDVGVCLGACESEKERRDFWRVVLLLLEGERAAVSVVGDMDFVGVMPEPPPVRHTVRMPGDKVRESGYVFCGGCGGKVRRTHDCDVCSLPGETPAGVRPVVAAIRAVPGEPLPMCACPFEGARGQVHDSSCSRSLKTVPVDGDGIPYPSGEAPSVEAPFKVGDVGGVVGWERPTADMICDCYCEDDDALGHLHDDGCALVRDSAPG